MVFPTLLLLLLLPTKGWGQATGAKPASGKVFSGVTITKALVRSAPRTDSKVLAQLKAGARVGIVSQSRYWYRLKLKFSDGSVREGWIEKSMVRLKSSSQAQAIGAGTTGTVAGLQSSEDEEGYSDYAVNHRIRAIMGPVYDIYRLGTTQFRIGGAYDYFLSEAVILDIPITYALGGGFSSIQGGIGFDFRMVKWGQLSMYGRTGGFFERFSGNGKSFVAGTLDLGLGLLYRWHPHFHVSFEPISFEITPITSNEVPWFVRGQVLVSLGGAW